MGARRIRRQQIQVDQKKSRLVNGILKVKERNRRDARIKAIVKKGRLPYLPSVMSWLSAKLEKPASRITQAEVDALVK
jgi:hypothetical protein